MVAGVHHARMAGMTELAGKTAVVTGGSSGIGRGIATRLVQAGMNVVIAATDRQKLTDVAAEIGAVGIPVDVTDPGSVQELAAATVDRFGAVHVVCNNAGVGPVGPVAAMTADDWRWIVDVNLFGVVHGVQAFLPLLQANPDGGHIVNTASVGGLVANAGMAGYAVTKFAVVALTESLAAELRAARSAVGATVLLPGPVRSELRNSMRNRPAGDRRGLVDLDLDTADAPFEVHWRDPLEVGDVVVRAIRDDALYAVTHPEAFGAIAARHRAIAAAFDDAAAR